MNQTLKQSFSEHSYMLLSRYQMDLDYFFGFGRQNENRLFFLNIDEHIKETRKLWDSLAVKPEWLTESQLVDYENRCKEFSNKANRETK